MERNLHNLLCVYIIAKHTGECPCSLTRLDFHELSLPSKHSQAVERMNAEGVLWASYEHISLNKRQIVRCVIGVRGGVRCRPSWLECLGRGKRADGAHTVREAAGSLWHAELVYDTITYYSYFIFSMSIALILEHTCTLYPFAWLQHTRWLDSTRLNSTWRHS